MGKVFLGTFSINSGFYKGRKPEAKNYIEFLLLILIALSQEGQTVIISQS